MKQLFGMVILLLPICGFGADGPLQHPYLASKFFASVGLFLPDQSMKLGLAGSIDVPEPEVQGSVDFSETLGIRTSDETFSAEVGWRFGSKWQLRGQYFRVDNHSRTTLDDDVGWGDYVFNSGTSVGAGTDMQITRLFFGRKFAATAAREYGIGLGGHILDLSAFINGNATVNGGDVGFVEERASASAPLPNVGAWFVYAFSPRIAARVRADWLSADYDIYDGHIVNAAASIGYSVTDHFGIGIAYNLFDIDFNVYDRDGA